MWIRHADEDAEIRQALLERVPESLRTMPKPLFVVDQRIAVDAGIGTIIALDDPGRKAKVRLDPDFGGLEIEVPFDEIFSIAEHKQYVAKYKDSMDRLYSLPGVILGDIQALKGGPHKKLDPTKQAALSDNIKDAIIQAKKEFAKLREKIEGGKK